MVTSNVIFIPQTSAAPNGGWGSGSGKKGESWTLVQQQPQRCPWWIYSNFSQVWPMRSPPCILSKQVFTFQIFHILVKMKYIGEINRWQFLSNETFLSHFLSVLTVFLYPIYEEVGKCFDNGWAPTFNWVAIFGVELWSIQESRVFASTNIADS